MTAERPRSHHVVGSWVAPALILAGIIVPQIALWSRLPPDLAIHWGMDGKPNGSAPGWLSLLLLAGLWVATWIWALRADSGTQSGAGALANAYFVGAFLVAGQIMLLNRSLGAGTWRDAGTLSPIFAVVPIGAGLVAWLLARRLLGYPAHAQARPSSYSARVPTSGRALWTGTARNRRGTFAFCAVGVVIGALGLISGQVGLLGAIVLTAVVCILALGFATARVTVGPRAVVVGLGPWGWPRKQVALDQVREATSTTVEPMSYGGWGYRVKPGVTAVVVRKGDALQLDLANGRSFVVTVDEAHEGAGLVNHYLTGAGRGT